MQSVVSSNAPQTPRPSAWIIAFVTVAGLLAGLLAWGAGEAFYDYFAPEQEEIIVNRMKSMGPTTRTHDHAHSPLEVLDPLLIKAGSCSHGQRVLFCLVFRAFRENVPVS